MVSKILSVTIIPVLRKYIRTYIHTYTYTFHGFVRLAQDNSMWDVSES